MSGDNPFLGKTVVIMGAHSRLGHRLAIKLALAQASLVLVDEDVAPLDPLVGRFPHHVDSVAIELGERSKLRQFASHWDDAPMDLLINLVPLRFTAKPGMQACLMDEIAGSFTSALSRSRGAAVSVWQQASTDDVLLAQAQDGTLTAAAAALARHLAKHKARGAAMRLAAGIEPSLAVDAVLHLASPTGVGLGPDAIPFVA